MEIKAFTQGNYDQVSHIYAEGLKTGLATFQNDIPVWQAWDSSHLQSCRLAAFEGDTMTGWAALSPVSSRCVYGGVAEVSIYIDPSYRNRGVGKLLLESLVTQSEQAGIWTLQSSIFPDNVGSIRLHEKCGFRTIGYREKIGKKDGVWKDNIIMERRSKIVGL